MASALPPLRLRCAFAPPAPPPRRLGSAAPAPLRLHFSLAAAQLQPRFGSGVNNSRPQIVQSGGASLWSGQPTQDVALQGRGPAEEVGVAAHRGPHARPVGGHLPGPAEASLGKPGPGLGSQSQQLRRNPARDLRRDASSPDAQLTFTSSWIS